MEDVREAISTSLLFSIYMGGTNKAVRMLQGVGPDISQENEETLETLVFEPNFLSLSIPRPAREPV